MKWALKEFADGIVACPIILPNADGFPIPNKPSCTLVTNNIYLLDVGPNRGLTFSGTIGNWVFFFLEFRPKHHKSLCVRAKPAWQGWLCFAQGFF